MRTVGMQEEPGTQHTAGSALDLRTGAVEFPPDLAAHNSAVSQSTVSVNQAGCDCALFLDPHLSVGV